MMTWSQPPPCEAEPLTSDCRFASVTWPFGPYGRVANQSLGGRVSAYSAPVGDRPPAARALPYPQFLAMVCAVASDAPNRYAKLVGWQPCWISDWRSLQTSSTLLW